MRKKKAGEDQGITLMLSIVCLLDVIIDYVTLTTTNSRVVGCLALPPPVPPPFVAGLEPVVRLLDCDVMVHLLKLVVKRALSKRPKAYSEVQLDRVGGATYKENFFLIG
jgi:hypothetical protein